MADSSKVFRFGDVVVDGSAFRVCRAGEALALEPKAVDVLLFLVERPGQLVSKADLLEGVWKDVAVTDNALTRVVAQLRRVLGDDAKRARYIETVPTRGYRFVAEVERVVAMESPEVTAEGVPAAEPRRARRHLLTAAVTVAVAALVAVAMLAGGRPKAEARARIAAGAPAQLTSSRGLDTFPALSPDGASLAYTSDRSGGFELWLLPLAPGGRELPLTSDGRDNCQPAWSPDGRLIAYHSRRRGGIWVIPALGGTPRQVAAFGSRPSFSRDGARLAFQSDGVSDVSSAAGVLPGSTIWIVPLEGGAARALTTAAEPFGGHASPVWSPDGRRIAFTSHSLHGTELWTVGVDDRTLLRIAGGDEGAVFDPVYAPDGHAIYYAAAGEPAVIRRRQLSARGEPDGEPEVVAPGSTGLRHLTLSGDGRSLAYVALATTSNLWSADLAQPTPTPRPFTNDTSQRNMLPAFAPDGRRVAFVARRGGLESDIWVADADGSHAAPLTTDPARDIEPQWFPDADRILFVSMRGAGLTLWQTRVSAPRDSPFELAPAVADVLRYARATQFQLHPRGDRLAFTAADGNVANLWSARLDGTGAVQLTFDAESIRFPRWSPDGRWLAAQVRRGEDVQVAIVPAEGGTPRLVTSGRGQHWVQSWSADGRQVAYAGLVDGRWNLWSVDVAGGTPRRITAYDRPALYVRYPSWSPRGDRIVYESGETTGNVWLLRLDR